jgi:hypothetical protein
MDFRLDMKASAIFPASDQHVDRSVAIDMMSTSSFSDKRVKRRHLLVNQASPGLTQASDF